jgi:Pectate lyase superfamily protein
MPGAIARVGLPILERRDQGDRSLLRPFSRAKHWKVLGKWKAAGGNFLTRSSFRLMPRLQAGMDLEKRDVSLKRKIDARSLTGALMLGICAVTLATSASAGGRCVSAPTSTLVVNVKDKGARGDGATDDTAAIQAAIDEAGGTGGTVLVPKGTYMIDAVAENRLSLKSEMTLKLSKDATLKAIPNDSKKYSILLISGVSNVTVTGGTLEGDRKEHKGESGEWGFGIRIDKDASHIVVSGMIAKNMWGDGFYVEGASDVSFCSVTADANRRQGLSVIAADGLLVLNSTFKNTRGTRPSAGIDFEPDDPDQKVNNVQIEKSQFLDNAGPGVLIAARKALWQRSS